MDEILLKRLIGGNIADISRICNLLSVQVNACNGKKINLHIQTFFRVLEKGKVIISSEDMYKCGKKCDPEKFNWDIPGESVFDDSLRQHRDKIFHAKILQMRTEYAGDVFLTLENEIYVQFLIDTAESEEKYRVFDDEQCMVISS